MTCSAPIDAAILADYWLAVLTETEEMPIEEHLLACDSCGDRLREIIAMAESLRKLAAEGNLRIVVSDAFLKRAAEQGARVREYAAQAGGRVECTVTPEDDLLIGRLAAGFGVAKQVDLTICDPDGAELARMVDIPFHERTASVAFQYPIGYAKAAPSMKMIFKLVAVDPSGDEVLGEYTFDHTRTMPGPPGW